jgi:hypothetical protein
MPSEVPRLTSISSNIEQSSITLIDNLGNQMEVIGGSIHATGELITFTVPGKCVLATTKLLSPREASLSPAFSHPYGAKYEHIQEY